MTTDYTPERLLLNVQSEDPFTFSHFGCWFATEDTEDDEGDDWDTFMAVQEHDPERFAEQLEDIASGILADCGIDPEQQGYWGNLWRHNGDVQQTFLELASRIAREGGWAVFLWDEGIEVYNPEDVNWEDQE